MADTAFKTPEELAAAQGLQTADFSQVQVMQPGAQLNSQFYKYAADPTVFQNANYQQPIVMQPNQVSGGTPLNLAQPTNDLTTADATAAGATQTSKTLQDYVKELTPPETALSTQQTDLTTKLNDLYGKDVGRAAYTAEQEQASGLVQRKKDMADINAQILQKNAEYEKAVQGVELNTGGVTSTAVTGLQGAIRRNQASDISLLQARALGMQGQVQAAQDAVNRAVDLKYQGIEEEITAKERQLKAIAPLLSAEQDRLAQAMQNKLADEKQRIADEKAKAKDNLTQATSSGVQTQFVNENGKFYDARTGIEFSSPQDFYKAAGVKSFEDAYAKGLVTDLAPSPDYSKYPASYQEYILAKREGFTGNYNDYQEVDANRKRSVTNNVTVTPEDKAITQFQKDAADYIDKLGADKVSWGTAWNALHAKYPQASNELIDATLGKSQYYNYTGAKQ